MLISVLKEKHNFVFQVVFTIYWMLAFIFFYSFYGTPTQTRETALVFAISFSFVAFIGVDVHSRFITQYTFTKKRYGRFALFSVFLFISIFWLECILSFVLHFYFWDYQGGLISENTIRIQNQVGGVNMVFMGGVAMVLMKDSYLVQRKREVKQKEAFELQLKLKELELGYLKSQINPHFLFNALNCIYGLSIEKSEKTAELTLQLSEILDYSLYQDEENALVSNEVKQIENFIAIQRCRFVNALVLKYSKSITEDAKVPPLLLLTLVENAFKHGKVNMYNQLIISIDIKCNKKLVFNISNSIDDAGFNANESGGIGLINLQRRLDLIYGSDYNLQIKREDNLYSTMLTINLLDNE